MSKRRVYYIDKGECSIDSLVDMFILGGSDLKCLMQWDPIDPEFVFFTYSIYDRKSCYKDFIRLFRNPNRVFIMLGYLLLEPDMNICDYAVSYSYINDGRHFRLPVAIIEQYENRKYTIKRNELSRTEAKELLQRKRFCNFIYSNAMVGPMREKLFRKISQYKTVESLGRVYHNTDETPNRNSENWWLDSIEKKANYKFSIACENGYYRGYTTEKLLYSLYAHSVPIYYGNPDVSIEFNERALINVHNYKSLDELIDRIREVDENDDKWVEMVCEPWQTEDQIEKSMKALKNYYDTMYELFSLSIKECIRRPMGTYMHTYYLRAVDHKWNYYYTDTVKRVGKKLLAKIKKELYRPWPIDEMYNEDMF